MQTWLRALKYEGRYVHGPVLGELMAVKLRSRHHIPLGTRILAVPTTVGRLARRGYNQADLLAEGVARKLRRRFLTGVVERLEETGPLNQLSPQARRKEVERAFRVVRPEVIKGQRILVVDDILTSGATLDSLSRVLLRAGAREVRAVVFAVAVRDVDLVG